MRPRHVQRPGTSPPGPLRLSVAEMMRRPCTRRRFSVQAPLTGLAVSSAAVREDASITVDVVLESLPEGLTVRGTVRAAWQGECRRCLRAVSADIVVEVAEIFDARPVEGETYPIDGDHVDLEPMVRDAVLLALPMAPLCDEACPGPAPELFPLDAADRPATRAGAGAALADPRWATLDDLRFD